MQSITLLGSRVYEIDDLLMDQKWIWKLLFGLWSKMEFILNLRFMKPCQLVSDGWSMTCQWGLHMGWRWKSLYSEEDENFLNVSFDMLDFLLDDIEANSLWEWSALSDCDNISSIDTEGWWAMTRDSLMALLKSVIFLDVMKEVTTDDNCVLHFSGDHNTPK